MSEIVDPIVVTPGKELETPEFFKKDIERISGEVFDKKIVDVPSGVKLYKHGFFTGSPAYTNAVFISNCSSSMLGIKVSDYILIPTNNGANNSVYRLKTNYNSSLGGEEITKLVVDTTEL